MTLSAIPLRCSDVTEMTRRSSLLCCLVAMAYPIKETWWHSFSHTTAMFGCDRNDSLLNFVVLSCYYSIPHIRDMMTLSAIPLRCSDVTEMTRRSSLLCCLVAMAYPIKETWWHSFSHTTAMFGCDRNDSLLNFGVLSCYYSIPHIRDMMTLSAIPLRCSDVTEMTHCSILVCCLVIIAYPIYVTWWLFQPYHCGVRMWWGWLAA